MAKSMGKSNGLHKAYFNGSPSHVGAKPNPGPKAPPPKPALKAPKGY